MSHPPPSEGRVAWLLPGSLLGGFLCDWFVTLDHCGEVVQQAAPHFVSFVHGGKGRYRFPRAPVGGLNRNLLLRQARTVDFVSQVCH
jgi:hypothetical protein